MNSLIDEERIALGWALISPTALDHVTLGLDLEDFHDPQNQRIYRLILAFRHRGEPVDSITLRRAALPKDRDYIVELAATVPAEPYRWLTSIKLIKQANLA